MARTKTRSKTTTQKTVKRATTTKMTARPLVPEMEQVFIDERRPLHYRELTDILIDRGVWEETPPTPAATVNALLTTTTKNNSSTPVFVRVGASGSGVYRYNRKYPKN